jgi:hypothetical protein
MAGAAVSTDLDALRYAADHHGVVTGAAAAALGVRAVELLDLVLGGELALWFTGSNVWVGAERPVDVLDSDPELVVQAAAHLAEELL